MFPPINKSIIFLISSNLFTQASFGFVAPVLAIFVVDNIDSATVAVAGTAVGIFWLVKAVLQLFVGWYLDKDRGEKDDYIALVVGHVIMGLAPFLYLLVDSTIGLYGVQIVLAVGGALSVPPWFAMFGRHIDENEENYEWSLNSSVSFGLGAGVSSIVGGWIVKVFGFNLLFITAGIFGALSTVTLIPLYHYLRKNIE